jgi:hypothetical protein
MGEVIASVLEWVAYGTGEVLLYVFTFGKRKPRWPYEGQDSAVLEELFYQGSTWLGLLFWAAVIAALLIALA